MKIAILGTKGVPGHHGVEVVVDSLLPHLVALGHEITVYGYSTYTHPSDDYKGGRILTVKGSPGKNTEMISHMLKASMDTRRRDYDIVHIHSVDPCLLAWLPRAGHGVVATSHGQAYIRKKWGPVARAMSRLAERIFIKVPRAVTSVSMPLADYYRARYGREVEYIPNGIEMRERPSAAHLKKWDLKPGGFLFCSAGRIERTKGLDTLLEAYRILKPDLPLVVAGGGSGTDPVYFDHLKATKPDGVTFAGFLTGDELFSLYAYPRVFVFPSEYEAMSMALLEGLSFGVPTVYSDTPENEAVAEDLGRSFRVSDPASLAGALREVLADYDRALETGRRAMEVVRTNHDWKTIAGQYDRLYRDLAIRDLTARSRPVEYRR
jgi:glycosyltransferase involved in cell wall biosynthesis